MGYFQGMRPSWIRPILKLDAYLMDSLYPHENIKIFEIISGFIQTFTIMKLVCSMNIAHFGTLGKFGRPTSNISLISSKLSSFILQQNLQ